MRSPTNTELCDQWFSFIKSMGVKFMRAHRPFAQPEDREDLEQSMFMRLCRIPEAKRGYVDDAGEHQEWSYIYRCLINAVWDWQGTWRKKGMICHDANLIKPIISIEVDGNAHHGANLRGDEIDYQIDLGYDPFPQVETRIFLDELISKVDHRDRETLKTLCKEGVWGRTTDNRYSAWFRARANVRKVLKGEKLSPPRKPYTSRKKKASV